MNKLLVCKKTRKYTADCLLKVLKEVLEKEEKISEAEFRDKWLKELRKSKDIFPDGWYVPPPHGMTVLFGTDEDFSRLNFSSIRPEKFWPRKDVYLNLTKGIAMLYASPVDKKTGIIGDFETTIYFGKKKKTKKHLKTNIEIIKKIYDYLQIGMPFSQIVSMANKEFKNQGLTNEVLSINDPTNTNIGHTIPFSYEEISLEENDILKQGDRNWQNMLTMISKKRKFVNAEEQLLINPGMAFTIEPRLKNSNNKSVPFSTYHSIILFKENGEKELLADYDEIFKLVGMDYML